MCRRRTSDIVATGLLERMWGWAARQCPNGSFEGVRAARIAEAIRWRRDPAAVLETLRARGWLDEHEGHLVIHGWPEHADRHVHRTLIRLGIPFWDGTPPTRSYAKDEAQRRRWDEIWGSPIESTPEADPGATPEDTSGAPLARSQKPEARSLQEEARAAWPLVVDAFKAYPGPTPSGELGAARLRVVTARLRDHPQSGPEILAQAVHGYWATHREKHGKGGEWDPATHSTPETIFRASNFAKYVERYFHQVAAGDAPPYLPGAVSAERRGRAHEALDLVHRRGAAR